MSDLTERLKVLQAHAGMNASEAEGYRRQYWDGAYKTLTEASERIEGLVRALEPFAKAFDQLDDDNRARRAWRVDIDVTTDQLRRARTALSLKDGSQKASSAEANHAKRLSGDAGVAGLTEPYRPVVVHYEEGDYLEYVERDVPTVAEGITPHLAIMRDMATRRIIGFRLADWSYLRTDIQPDWPLPAPPIQPDTASTDAPLEGVISVETRDAPIPLSSKDKTDG